MRAHAVVEAERRGGLTRCTRLRSDPPITFRRTGLGVVHQVASGAGPVGGDDLRLSVRVGPGAALVLRTVAASIVLPGPTGEPSRLTVDADVAEGGSLEVLPCPQVIARGADHEVSVRVALGPGAHLRWRDETVLGRHGELGGSLRQRIRVEREGRPVATSELALGPRWPGSLGPAVVGGHRCVGSLLLVGGEGFEEGGGPGWAAFDLGRGATLVTAVADRPDQVAGALDGARAHVKGL